MIRFALAAVALAALLPACGGAPVELSKENPLGTLADIEKVLTEKGFEKSKRTFTVAEVFEYETLTDLTVWVFEEHPTSSLGVKHWVLVGVDDGGRVMALGGKFASQSDGFTTSGTKTQKFLAEIWREIAGGEPSFTRMNRPGVDVDEYLMTRLSTPLVEGYWEKTPNSKMASHTRSIWDALILRRRG